MAFERAIAAPKRNVGAGLLDDIDAAAKKMRTDISYAARRMAIGGIMPQPAREPAIEFCKIVSEIAADAVHGAQAAHIVTRIVDETGYMSSIRSDLAEEKNKGDKDADEDPSTQLTNTEYTITTATGTHIYAIHDPPH